MLAENTEWKWDVKPKSAGKHPLHLTLSALVTIEGEPTLRTIKTFDRDIFVEITPVQRAGAFIAGNWQWLWVAVLIPLATWWWKRRAKGDVAYFGIGSDLRTPPVRPVLTFGSSKPARFNACCRCSPILSFPSLSKVA